MTGWTRATAVFSAMFASGAALGAGPTGLPDAPCATMARLPGAPALIAPRGPQSIVGGKILRDYYGVPNVRTSANFAVWWGNLGSVSVADVDRLLDSLELSWSVQIGDMGHPAPLTTDQYYFNVYIGDTGSGTPAGYGAGGYYYVDPLGYPMVVIANDSLYDMDFADHAAAHEFYHAIQGSTNRYAYEGVSAWYWESTAEWAAVETEPNNPYNGPFVFSYMLLPQLPVNAFDYPDTGALEEYYQYGAFVFPLDLAEALGPDVIRDSWIDNGREPDPIEVLRSLASSQSQDLDEIWLDHIGHNAVYDYDAGDLYRAITEAYAPYFPTGQEIAETVSRDGGSGTVSGPLAPRRYGAANIKLNNPTAGTLEVRITGEVDGSDGSPAQYGARVVRVLPNGSLDYHEVPFDGVDGSLDLPDVGDEDEIFLVVGAWTETWRETRWLDERFPFDWSLAVVEPATTTTEPTDTTDTTTDTTDTTDAPPDKDDTIELPTDCSCAAASGSGHAGGLAALLALVALRRRR